MIMQTYTQTDAGNSSTRSESLKGWDFRIEAVSPSTALLIGDTAVFKVVGKLCAMDAKCPHLGGRLNEGTLEDSTVTCPWRGSERNVCTGAVLRGPAKERVKTDSVTVEGEIGYVETGK
jgi:nitrite reductase/ring-hydroxylating ferredoxin subunit